MTRLPVRVPAAAETWHLPAFDGQASVAGQQAKPRTR